MSLDGDKSVLDHLLDVDSDDENNRTLLDKSFENQDDVTVVTFPAKTKPQVQCDKVATSVSTPQPLLARNVRHDHTFTDYGSPITRQGPIFKPPFSFKSPFHNVHPPSNTQANLTAISKMSQRELELVAKNKELTTKLNDWQNKTDNLTSELAHAEENLEAKKAEYESLQRNFQSLEKSKDSNIEDLQDEITQKNRELTSLQLDRDRLQKKVTKHKQEHVHPYNLIGPIGQQSSFSPWLAAETLVPVFGGAIENSQCSLNTFFTRLDSFKQLHQVPDDLLLNILKVKLTGHARHFVQSLPQDVQDDLTLIKTALYKRFGANSLTYLQREDLLSLSQQANESVRQFTTRLCYNFDSVGSLTSAEKAKYFVKGLKPSLRRQIYQRVYTSPDLSSYDLDSLSADLKHIKDNTVAQGAELDFTTDVVLKHAGKGADNFEYVVALAESLDHISNLVDEQTPSIPTPTPQAAAVLTKELQDRIMRLELDNAESKRQTLKVANVQASQRTAAVNDSQYRPRGRRPWSSNYRGRSSNWSSRRGRYNSRFRGSWNRNYNSNYRPRGNYYSYGRSRYDRNYSGWRPRSYSRDRDYSSDRRNYRDYSGDRNFSRRQDSRDRDSSRSRGYRRDDRSSRDRSYSRSRDDSRGRSRDDSRDRRSPSRSRDSSPTPRPSDDQHPDAAT